MSSRLSTDRWEKATDRKPDLPYPERARTRSPLGRDRERERDRDRQGRAADRDSRPPGRTSISPEVRFKGAHRASRDAHDASAPGSKSPSSEHQPSSPPSSNWWEQSTYNTPKEGKPSTKKSPGAEHEGRGAAANARGPRGRDGPSDTQARTGPSTRDRRGSDRNLSRDRQHSQQSNHSSSSGGRQGKDKTPWWEQATYGPSASAKEEKKKDEPESVPWWEQATYGAKKTTTTTTSSPAGNGSPKEKTRLRDSRAGEKASTLQSIGLLSRGGETSASAPSVKDRKVQEDILSELQQKISRLDKEFGPPAVGTTTKSPAQVSQLEGIVEAFRKLREGLFATEAKDTFAARVINSMSNQSYAVYELATFPS
ncbi:hypothetical protein BGZ73_000453 [Actinomortierella ambigua]|nr:hypothetical protein BGZ73_000453 [Actinomortierella ambigua]